MTVIPEHSVAYLCFKFIFFHQLQADEAELQKLLEVQELILTADDDAFLVF